MKMTSSQAVSILSSHPAMVAIGGLLAGGGALVHNVVSQPVLDEYGNVLESNDINPFLAAAGGAVVGGLGSYGYQKLKGMQQKPQYALNIPRSSRRTPDVVNAEFNDIGADNIDNYWTANSSIDPRYQPEFIQDPWTGSVNPNPARQPNPNAPQGWTENRQMLALPASTYYKAPTRKLRQATTEIPQRTQFIRELIDAARQHIAKQATTLDNLEATPKWVMQSVNEPGYKTESVRYLTPRSKFGEQLTPIRELSESQAIDRQIEIERIKQAKADRYSQSQYGRNASDVFSSPYTV